MLAELDAPELEPEFGIPALGIPEFPLGEDCPGLGSEGIDDPAPALPPDGMLLLLSDPELPELDDEEELELDEELPEEPEEPDDDEDDEGDEGEGIDEGICCSLWQPPIKNAPVALAAANWSAIRHARFTADRGCV
jgi:hypothetical protein